jgi:hypothetical protein
MREMSVLSLKFLQIILSISYCRCLGILSGKGVGLSLSRISRSHRHNGVIRLRLANIDEHDLTKIFGRFADKILLLDIPGAGTPEMMNCCQ